MTKRRSEPETAERDASLAQLRSTYDEYEATGYVGRWRGSWAGWQRVKAEQDAWLIAAVGDVSGAVVLDVGCGNGDAAVALDNAGIRPARYIGVDLLARRIADARERVPWAEFIVASADRLPLDDSSVDVVIAMTLLSSLVEPALLSGVASEIARVVQPGGRLVVYDLRYPSPGNVNVRPIRTKLLRSLFPGWHIAAATLTLLPPLARTRIASSARAYRFLTAIPPLRSHLAAVLTK